MTTDGKLEFTLRGPFRVTTPDGTDITPQSMKACGLLAILLDAPCYRRARSILQDKLWSDRDPSHGAASLRQALTQIRRSFGPWSDVLVADLRTVALKEEAVSVRWTDDGGGGEILEGLDVADPEFEDWLRSTRQAHARPDATQSAVVLDPFHGDETPILLLDAPPPGQDAHVIADYIQSDIARGVADWGGVEIRWSAADDKALLSGPVFRLEVHGQGFGDGVALRLRLTSEPSGQVCWQVSEFLPEIAPAVLGRLINSCVDRTIAAFSGARPHGGAGPVLEYFADMQMMFYTQGRDYDSHHRMFAERFEKDGRGIDLAWQAFLSCWAIGERHPRDLDAVRDEARALMRRAIEIEPYNALVHALASHVFGFVLNEYPVAHELASRSIELDRNCTLGWAFLATAQINLGEFDKAYQNIRHARALSAEGPHKAFLDSLTVMIGTVSGHADAVMSIGETLIALRPDYAAPLRYMLAGYLSSGDHARGERVLSSLRQVEPDFEISMFAESEYPVAAMRTSRFIDLQKIRRLV